MPRWTVALALAAGLLASAGAPASRVVAQSDVARFNGTYRHVGGSRDQGRITQAINRVADRMNIFLREFARAEMRRRVRPERRVFLEANDDAMRLGLDRWGPLRLPWGESVNHPDLEGSAARNRAERRGDRLFMRQDSPNGYRENTFQLNEDGRHLYLRINIVSPNLPAPIRYTLTYRRR